MNYSNILHYSSFDMKQESIYANFRRESHVLKGIAFSFIRLFLLDFGTVSTVWYFCLHFLTNTFNVSRSSEFTPGLVGFVCLDH